MLETTPKFYTWKNFRCAYEVHTPQKSSDDNLALLLIHPIGVGLSGCFWHRFIKAWLELDNSISIYNPDLLGCGNSDMPRAAYYPSDWGQQLHYFLENVVKTPAIVVTQGALPPVAIALRESLSQPNLIKGLVFAGPPSWKLITQQVKPIQQKLIWNLLFDSLLGDLFYRYARRRKFIESFSVRQLFAEAEAVDAEWLDNLEIGAVNLESRYAVFSFLAGFWRQDYKKSIANISEPTLVVFGEKASSIDSTGASETPQQRLDLYLKHLPKGQGKIISGRNVLPYESTDEFVGVVSEFVEKF